MALPSITIIGNLTADPELRWTQAGKPVVNFRVACNERRKNEAGEWVDGESLFIKVVSWRSSEAIANSISKGTRVVVYGDLVQNDYEQDGVKKSSYEVRALSVAKMIYDTNGQPTGATSLTENLGGWAKDNGWTEQTSESVF